MADATSGTETTATVETVQPETAPQETDALPEGAEQLGDAGKKALDAMKASRNEYRDQLKSVQGELEKLAPLQKLAEALGGSGAEAVPTDIEKITERLTKHETELAGERQARWRAEIANETGLSVEQAARLVGTSKDELAADAAALLALFPATPVKPGVPRPDPSQGGQGGNGVNLDSQIAEAQKAGDVRKVIALQRQKLQNQ